MILTCLIFLGICNKVVGVDGARLCGEQAGSGRHSGQQGTCVTALPAAAAPQRHDGDAGSNTLPSRGGICASRYQSTCLHVQT